MAIFLTNKFYRNDVSESAATKHERHCFDTKFLYYFFWLTWKEESTSTRSLSGAAFHKLLEDCSLSDSEYPGSRIATSVGMSKK